jgi:hypothetical protein
MGVQIARHRAVAAVDLDAACLRAMRAIVAVGQAAWQLRSRGCLRFCLRRWPFLIIMGVQPANGPAGGGGGGQAKFCLVGMTARYLHRHLRVHRRQTGLACDYAE